MDGAGNTVQRSRREMGEHKPTWVRRRGEYEQTGDAGVYEQTDDTGERKQADDAGGCVRTGDGASTNGRAVCARAVGDDA